MLLAAHNSPSGSSLSNRRGALLGLTSGLNLNSYPLLPHVFQTSRLTLRRLRRRQQGIWLGAREPTRSLEIFALILPPAPVRRIFSNSSIACLLYILFPVFLHFSHQVANLVECCSKQESQQLVFIAACLLVINSCEPPCWSLPGGPFFVLPSLPSCVLGVVSQSRRLHVQTARVVEMPLLAVESTTISRRTTIPTESSSNVRFLFKAVQIQRLSVSASDRRSLSAKARRQTTASRLKASGSSSNLGPSPSSSRFSVSAEKSQRETAQHSCPLPRGECRG